jgi:hypothetical protein
VFRGAGRSFRGEAPPLTAAQRDLRSALERDLRLLAADIGERHVLRPDAWFAAAALLERGLEASGRPVRRQLFHVGAVPCENLEIEIPGQETPGEVVVVGAHYDTVPGCPGANDNGTGCVAVLALARAFARRRVGRTLRFLLFANEEPPFFQTEHMGSLIYAGRCRERGERIVAMVSLETIGHYDDEVGSQSYPLPVAFLYPSRANFLAFVGNRRSRALVAEAVTAFRARATLPSEAAALPGWIRGVGWSDHWSFWQAGYPAIMVTDTAPYRYAHYHAPTDIVERVHFEGLTRAVDGLEAVVAALARAEPAAGDAGP